LNAFQIAAIAIAMSTDAFAAAVVKGVELERPRWSEALRTGLIFGVIEGITPVVGWMLGSGASRFVQEWDHWIAFALLAGLGARMVRSGLSRPAAGDGQTEKPTSHPFWLLALTGFATSIDAMAIGVGLAFVDVPIWTVAVAIGCATFGMVTLGVMAGRALGAVAGRRAELVGGLLLIAIGATILDEHLRAPIG
jgi:putative Mn2+ efflux pump MntP